MNLFRGQAFAVFLALLVLNVTSVALARPISSEPVRTPYPSGLVVDARGLKLEKSVAPNIVDVHGIIVNSIITVTPGWSSNYGSVEYYDTGSLNSVLEGKSRAGNDYLMVKAVGLRKNNADVIVSSEDADRLLKIQGIREIFKEGKIVFIF